jgi:hypothetical protein
MSTFDPTILPRPNGWFGCHPKGETRFDKEEHPSTRRTWFWSDGSRYLFDANLGNGWRQYDTHQDASYHGIWVNAEARQVVVYCEGDLSVETFDTQEGLIADLASKGEFYKPGRACATLGDDGSFTEHFDDRPNGRLDQVFAPSALLAALAT